MLRIGKNIKMFRDQLDMTQEELATRVNLSGGAQIAQFEAGTKVPSLEKAMDIATQLGVTLAQLVGEVAPPTTVTNNANGDHQTVYQHVEGCLLPDEVEQTLNDSLRSQLEVHCTALRQIFDVTVMAEAIRLAVREGMREAFPSQDGQRPQG